MYGIDNYYVFLATTMLFIMSPGMDTMFVLNKSIGQGRKAGIYSMLGINCGVLVHTLFAALGLSMIIAQSALAFAILKYLGAAYLIYMGISALLSKKALVFDHETTATNSNWQNFYSGIITNVLNPKVALFFLSFFPQFINSNHIDNPLPFILLGVTYSVLGVAWLLVLALFAALFSERLKRNPSFNQALNRTSSVIYILMGVNVALSKK